MYEDSNTTITPIKNSNKQPYKITFDWAMYKDKHKKPNESDQR